MSRFTFPQASDPNMHREEVLTLARTTSQQQAINKANGDALAMTMSAGSNGAPRAPRRKHFVFTDPVAFRYLEEDSATVVLERRGKLKGYELYLVEQWACSRVHPTFVITTYTGDESHAVMVGVLGVPADEEAWSPRLRVYFKAITQFHARPKETPLGTLMVTNLSSFPSALTVIPVTDGDVRKHREDFIVNENLKRLGCSGRSGMNLSAPAGATQAKFFQLYKTSDRIPLYGAVIELVKLCQVALMMFGKLEQEYADGMLCDVTEKAINDWWTEIGSEHFNVEPTDGILGPTTVSALLGLLMGARNRLNYYGAPVSKDAFDVYSLKRGVAYFQKGQKLEKTRRLDRHTLDRLHRVTAKAAAGEGWAVPKAVKSTVVELSGKGGEMVMGMVGRGDKAGISDIETLNLDQFVNLVHGERGKWLWYGKPRRTGMAERVEHIGGNYTFAKADQGGYMWSHNRSHSVPPDEEAEAHKRKEDSPNAVYSARPPGSALSMVDSPNEKDRELRKTVFKSVTGKMSDAKSGFGRIKDAVGLRGHTSRPSKEDASGTDDRLEDYFDQRSSTPLAGSVGTPSSPPTVGRAFTWKNTPGDYQNGVPKAPVTPAAPRSQPQDLERPLNVPIIKEPDRLPPQDQALIKSEAEAEKRWAAQVRDIRRDLIASDEPSVGGSTNGDDLEGPILSVERDPHNFQILLHRRHSIAECHPSESRDRHEAWWPRHMSFTHAEEAILGWEPAGVIEDTGDVSDNWPALRRQLLIANDSKTLYEHVLHLRDKIGPWVVSKVDSIEALDEQAAHDQEGLQALYYQLFERYQAAKQNSQDLLEDERSHVMEAMKDVEVLGSKLEYEINSLVSKVQDVEDGVSQFERQVDDLESRANELQAQLLKESWPHWLVRTITGIGTGPNVVAPL